MGNDVVRDADDPRVPVTGNPPQNGTKSGRHKRDPEAGDHEVAVAAVTLRPGRELTAREIGRALGALEIERKPALVEVVDRIPVTTWYRPHTGELRKAGIPEASESGRAWYLDAGGQTYRALTAAARQRLTRPARETRGAPRPSTA